MPRESRRLTRFNPANLFNGGTGSSSPDATVSEPASNPASSDRQSNYTPSVSSRLRQTVQSISYPTTISNAHSRLRDSRLGTACRRGWYWKSKERNLVSAMLSMLAVALIGASLADQQWFYLTGGNCPLDYLGVPFFYRLGHFKEVRTADPVFKDGDVTQEYHKHVLFTSGKYRYVDCTTPMIADLFHGLIGTCFVALSTSLVAFFLDLLGPKKGFLRWLKRNAVFSVFTVILCILVIGLCYWLSGDLEELQKQSSSAPEKVRVEYSEGFYMIVASAVLSLGAVTSSLFRLSKRLKEEEDRVTLLENMVNSMDSPSSVLSRSRAASDAALGIGSDLHPGSLGPPPPLGMILNVPPPPPYEP